MKIADIPSHVLPVARRGGVIPAMPLALTGERKFSEKHQKALTRYYVDAGASGIAVGVHSTQFEIRQPGIDLFEPVLELVSREIDACAARRDRAIFKVAGVCGKRDQALQEAAFARDKGYHACLLSLAALKDTPVPALIEHCRLVADVMPVIGFYLQPAVGGRILPYGFWRRFAQLDNVLAIKMAPFNRYQTFDVIRGVCESGREEDIALYTGNDDSIVIDLLTEYRVHTDAGEKRARLVGGLLGHWAVWTRKAVELLAECHAITARKAPIPEEMLTRAAEITDCNAAFFDAAHGFAGCIPGLHEVLRRQGLLPGTWCLNPNEVLSPGQAEEIDRVYAAYPHLNDDAFVLEHRHEWLSG